ncbi:MAG TPA: hydroxyacid dehydrogenase [Terriglobia bacterium]|nr:hydroxyacid dehydrogenase [Terriglobia bacterium]
MIKVGEPRKPLRIVSTGRVPPIVLDILGRFGPVEVLTEPDEDGLVEAVRDAAALLVRGTAKVPARVIEAASALRVIGRSGVGYDGVDIAAATARGIPVVYTPGAGSRAVAEGALAVIFALLKRLPSLDRETRAGNWNAREAFAAGDIEGAVLGLVGLGRIGREVARLAAPFGMRILAHDPAVSRDEAASLGVKLAGLEQVLAESDAVSLHAPLTESTRGMIDRQRLHQMKRGAILVNLARGGLVENLDVLHEALLSGQLSALGLDVFPAEPPDVRHPIFSHPNLLCTPHALGLTARSTERIFTMVSNDIAAVLEGRRPEHVVNPEVFDVSL